MQKKYIRWRFSMEKFNTSDIIVYILVLCSFIVSLLQKGNSEIIINHEWNRHMVNSDITMLQYILYAIAFLIIFVLDICKNLKPVTFYWMNYIKIFMINIIVLSSCAKIEYKVIVKIIILCNSIIDVYCLVNKRDEILKLYNNTDGDEK